MMEPVVSLRLEGVILASQDRKCVSNDLNLAPVGRPVEKSGGILASNGLSSTQLPLHSRQSIVHPFGGRFNFKNLLLSILTLVSVLAFFLQRHPVHQDNFILSDLDTKPKQLRNPAYLIQADHGAVASENEWCSKIGVDVLKEGGNAVDAIVSTTLCVGVLNMFSSGIGGGGFMIVRIPPSSTNGTSEVFTINFRETAPALANTTMYMGRPLASLIGGLAVGVPGELRGLEEAHRRWGKLEWRRLVQPSVDLAAGWRVQRELAERLQIDFFHPLMLKNPDWSAVFAPKGELLREGEIIRRTNYSRTLAEVASKGAGVLYEGPIADSIVRKIQATGGILTHEDLMNYRVHVERALEGTYRDKKVYTLHAPTSGPVLLHMLNVAEHYDLPKEGRTGVNVHRMVEMMRFGFAARTKVCDPAFNNESARINEISTKEFADSVVMNLTDDRTHPPAYYNPVFDIDVDHGTSHSSVIDKDGMAVALTSTVNLVFGSQVLDPETGIILNDEMDDFSTPGTPNVYGLWPSPYNYPEPGKRPLSSTVPTILEYPDGSFYLAIGGSGGTRIFPAVFQVILNLEWGLDVSQAIEYGRMHDQLYPMYVDVDDVYPADLVDALRERGHNITISDINRVAAVVNAVMMKEDGKIFAASDSRKNGIAAGY